MSGDCITYSKILKRYKSLNSSINNSNRYNSNLLLSKLESCNENTNKDLYLNSINKALLSIENESINDYGIGYVTKIISLNNNIDVSNYNSILSEVKNIIPFIIDNEQAIDEVNNCSIIYENQKQDLISLIKENIISDRILANHDSISKRFKIDNQISNINNAGFKTSINNICEMIDTYKIPLYQKVNITIEESVYLLEKNGIEYEKQNLVENVTTYFLLSANKTSSKDISGIKYVLTESYCLNNDDITSVSYLWDDELQSSSVIMNAIHNYIKSEDKNQYDLLSIFDEVNYASCNDLCRNLDKLLMFIYDACMADSISEADAFNIEDVKEKFDSLLEIIYSKIEEADSNRGFIKYLLEMTIKTRNLINNSIESKNIIGQKTLICRDIISVLDEFIEKLSSIGYTVYNKDNIDNMNYMSESSNIISIEEAKIIKFNNLIKAALNINNSFKEKSKNFAKKIKNKFISFNDKIKNFIYSNNKLVVGESTVLYDYLTENNQFDICLMRVKLENADEINSAHAFLNSLCEDANIYLSDNKTIDAKCYYTINSNYGEIHIQESSIIENKFNNDSSDKILNDFSLSESLNELSELTALSNYISESAELDNFENYLCQKIYKKPISIEEYETLIEAFSILNLDKSTVDLITEKCIDNLSCIIYESEGSEAKYLVEVSKFNNIKDSYLPYTEATFNEAGIALSVINYIFESKKDENIASKTVNKVKETDKELAEKGKEIVDKAKDTAEKKNPFKGIKLSNIKLYLHGLKQKFKNLTTKEKEICNKIDNNYKVFVKDLERANLDTKREAIIKGNVIPSFSKCIKTGIAVAGLTIFGNPILGAALAIGSFATNKSITNKERTLICDEIETELQVIDKEIANAESRNQLKKYRALITQKKALQREYQRIRYNIKSNRKLYISHDAGTDVSEK